MTKYSYYLLLSCLMFLAGCQTVEPLAIDYMLPADVSFPPSLKRVAIVNNMPEVPDNKPILAKEKKKDDFEIAKQNRFIDKRQLPLIATGIPCRSPCPRELLQRSGYLRFGLTCPRCHSSRRSAVTRRNKPVGA